MPLTSVQVIVITIYTILFVVMMFFFEARLSRVHRRHVEKIWPVGEEWLHTIHHKLKVILRIIFTLLFVLSIIIILTTL